MLSLCAAAFQPRVCRGRRRRACPWPTSSFWSASRRWSALLTQTKSRIGHQYGMRKRLGETNWAAFVRYAEAEHKDAFFRAFTPVSGVLRCEGKIKGTPCPKAIRVDLCATTRHECGDVLPGLHLDHSYDVQHICDVWSEALPKDPVSWDDGLCGALVAHLLLGVEEHVLAQCSTRPIWKPQLTFSGHRKPSSAQPGAACVDTGCTACFAASVAVW